VEEVLDLDEISNSCGPDRWNRLIFAMFTCNSVLFSVYCIQHFFPVNCEKRILDEGCMFSACN
jgi:hypothetical protein